MSERDWSAEEYREIIRQMDGKLTATRLALTKAEELDDELTDSLNKTLEYARKLAGRRDVHSVEEVLDELQRKLTKAEGELAEVRTCIASVEIAIAPREDTADWLAQVLQVLVMESGNYRKQLQQVETVARELLAELENVRRGKLSGFLDLIQRAHALLGPQKSPEGEGDG